MQVQAVDTEQYLSSPGAIRALSEPLRSDVMASLAEAIGFLYLLAVPLVILALVLAIFIEERPLRTTIGDGDETGTAAADLAAASLH